MSEQLTRLAKPFPSRFVAKNPTGYGSYVTHSVVNEKLLAVVGPFDFALVEIVRGDVAGAKTLTNVVVGAICRLTCYIDGRLVNVEEIGDVEHPGNWPHDGARLKDAFSDALKRCAMRLGVGLHLWSQEEFTLYDQLVKRQGPDAFLEEGEIPARPPQEETLPL